MHLCVSELLMVPTIILTLRVFFLQNLHISHKMRWIWVFKPAALCSCTKEYLHSPSVVLGLEFGYHCLPWQLLILWRCHSSKYPELLWHWCTAERFYKISFSRHLQWVTQNTIWAAHVFWIEADNGNVFFLVRVSLFKKKKIERNISFMDVERWKSHCDKCLSKKGKEVLDLE